MDIKARMKSLLPPHYALNVTLEEGERQIILLALFKLKRQRPGWTYAVGEIEKKLGGQLDWPEPQSEES